MFPYPLLTISLLGMWVLLNGVTIGQVLLGSIVAVCSTWALAALRPEKPKLRKWYLLPKLFGLVMLDIIRSNISASVVILRGRTRGHRSAFINVPLELKDPTALAVLAIIVTGTPGSAWLEYDSRNSSVLLHVLDLVDEDEWRDLLKNRYETLLLEIFS
ncbi:Na+/H+ antiporter subunit E [Rhizobium sp. PRIMUS64]|uniref:Na+/H+ antiporter subunit E n=1 Tax=Rhizobium sp. PRIMUS64 TaxID=2908925 RepID=UPI001FF39CC0|nr:Na+/H+ antiporter subunit E [Rhizobium sp. PRIMUS64]MCJ9691399.1 Na+/H+ antiporter subunit E [Rhizobium sp. PRIMUS64]